MVTVNKKNLLDSYSLPTHHYISVRSYSDLEIGLLELEDKKGNKLYAVQYARTLVGVLIPEEQFTELISSI